jgi:hypothetical protein
MKMAVFWDVGNTLEDCHLNPEHSLLSFLTTVNFYSCSELSSGLYCRVKLLSTDVSEVRTASIIIPDDNFTRRRENLKSHNFYSCLIFPELFCLSCFSS